MNPVLPVYYQIKQTIKGWIISKEFGRGEKIPTENELVERFRASRLTVRQAISQLVQEGFLNSRRGEGTFVTANESLINSFSLETSGFMDELFSYQVSKVMAKSVEIGRIGASKLVKEKLGLDAGTKEVVQIKRIRYLGDRLFTYTVNYLPVDIGAKVNEKMLYEKTLLRTLEEDCGVQFTEAVQTLEASFADQEVAEKLEIASGSPILFVERIMYGKKRKPVELFQSFYRGDLYRFIVRFKNVKKQWKPMEPSVGSEK
jgi:GntR family transcriptional regulator